MMENEIITLSARGEAVARCFGRAAERARERDDYGAGWNHSTAVGLMLDYLTGLELERAERLSKALNTARGVIEWYRDAEQRAALAVVHPQSRAA